MKRLQASRVLMLSAFVVLATSAAAQESDREYARRVTAEAVPGCANAAKVQLNLPAEAATSVCSCAFRRMFSEHPIKELRMMAKANDREASGRIMRPLMLACYEREMKRAK